MVQKKRRRQVRPEDIERWHARGRATLAPYTHCDEGNIPFEMVIDNREPEPYDALMRNDYQMIIQEVLQTTSTIQREIFQLYYTGNFTHPEIAERVDASVNGVRSTIFRTSERIRKLIADRESEKGEFTYTDATDAELSMDDVARDCIQLETISKGTARQRRYRARITASADAANNNSIGEDVPRFKKIPKWMAALTEESATQLYNVLTDKPSKAKLRAFFKQLLAPGENRKEEKLARTTLNQADGVQAQLIQFIHDLGNSERVLGKFVQSPNLLRAREQQEIIIPNLNTLIVSHFKQYPKLESERTLLDIGAWDGRLTSSLRDYFGAMYAVEPNPQRFGEMLKRRTPKLIPIQATAQRLMEMDDIPSPDVILMSHLLYFFQDEKDDELLNWAVEKLPRKGLLLTVLNDLVPDGATRAHLRRELHGRERNPWPSRYSEYLQRKGMSVSVMRPSLRCTSTTPEGLEATRDLMRFMLPRESQGEESLEQYVQRYVANRNGVGQHQFTHTLYIMAARKQ